MYDLEGLAHEINSQKEHIYVEPECYKFLKSAKSSLEVNRHNPKHTYVSLDRHKERIF